MTKQEIADVLDEIATLLELKGENPFKVRAYQAGGRVIESIEEAELSRLVAESQLESVKGIGAALAQKITEMRTAGRLEFFEKLKASIAPGLVEMLQIPGLGPKKIKALHDKLGISDIAGLSRACSEGRVAGLDGFGEKTQEKILAGIKNREAYGQRRLWWEAWEMAEPIVAGLRALAQVSRAEAAGSLRRGLETIGDLDFIVAAREVAPVVDWFINQPRVKEVTAKGETKASVRFETGLQADLRIVPEEQFIFALHHFTGSKDHNVQMRQRALARGLSLSEWGLTPVGDLPVAGERRQAKGVKAPKDEAGLFSLLELPFIAPELREGLGEIEAAESGKLPRLIELSDLRGAFHNHTTASDGHNTLAEMAAAAARLGWEYLGISDHSKSSRQANGLSEESLLGQIKEIRALNAGRKFRTHIFAGVECDIRTDGRLDYEDGILTQLDYVVVSVHNAMAQDEAVMTARIIRAVEHPCTTMLGHLTGRLLLRREGYPVNVGKVIDAAIANGVVIELNASPQRLDMDWRHWRKAAEKGLFCAINPDAHDTAGLEYVRTGIHAARKGWLARENVLNTRSLVEIRRWLEEKKENEDSDSVQPMPIYEYYCPDNHRIYQFYAKTLAQGQTIPKCPDNPDYRMEKILSTFAVGSAGGKTEGGGGPSDGSAQPDLGGGDSPEDARAAAAMAAMEGEFSNVDENDPRAMGRMMRRMAEMTGERMDGEMEEVVRKLEEGTDPEALEEQLGGGALDAGDPDDEGMGGPLPPSKDVKEPPQRFRAHRGPPRRDPKLYDY